ncbi:AraC family transcriptional regulator ligand-binding domain-containing protein [Amycolatopsis halotolerans]|uniref:AraC family transcriptional regulator ligand-binding domain-containing protein n=1 Tax=Amycolatopsis halotolerans TaxID=330083 RepID=A0ABV7QHF7_9PSEU
MDDPAVLDALAQRLARIGERRNLDVPALLRRLGIPPDRTGVTRQQVSELTRELWLQTDDELFALGPRAPRGLFRLVVRSVAPAPDLRAALHRLEEAAHVLPGMPAVAVRAVAPLAEVEIDVRQLADPEHVAAELVAIVVHRLLGWLTGQRIDLRELRLPWPKPDHAPHYELVFGRHPQFDADALVLSFDGKLLPAPVIRSEAELAEFLEDQPDAWLATRDYGSALADQVRAIVEQGTVAPDDIADRLGISAQHLRRRLRGEGTSIGEIRDGVRRDAAIASLSRGDESIEKLAQRLGFSEASAFRRAFRRWTGRTPADYR